jgi:hypothetical protein
MDYVLRVVIGNSPLFLVIRLNNSLTRSVFNLAETYLPRIEPLSLTWVNYFVNANALGQIVVALTEMY